MDRAYNIHVEWLGPTSKIVAVLARTEDEAFLQPVHNSKLTSSCCENNNARAAILQLAGRLAQYSKESGRHADHARTTTE